MHTPSSRITALLIICLIVSSIELNSSLLIDESISSPPKVQDHLSFVRPSEDHNASDFFDPNIMVNTENIVKFRETGKHYCFKPQPLGLRIAVTHRIVHIIPDSENRNISETSFHQFIEVAWDTMISDCNASEVILVSRRPECHIHPRCQCHHLLYQAKPDHNIINCFEDILKPIITIYQQILNGTHPCHADVIEDHNTHTTTYTTIWIVIGIVVSTIIIGCAVYHRLRKFL